MSVRAIHWHEGMFLRPHHFQTEQRYWYHLLGRNGKWDVHYNWGLRTIDLDLDALANYRCAVRSLSVRLRDGTTIIVPEDGNLPEVELKAAFEQSPSVTVFLGVPVFNLGRACVPGEGPGEELGDGARYLLDVQELEDENTGVNPQPVHVRLLNLKLLLSTQDHSGYDVVPLARIQKSLRAEATPQLDESFIPPVLACDAWKPLAEGLVRAVYDRVGKKIEVVAAQVVGRGISFDSHSQGDMMLLAQLRELNSAYTRLGVLAFAQGLHPFAAYVELCGLVGQLSVFSETHRPPELPRYDHDDLGGCFFRVKQQIDALLDLLVEPAYQERPFVGLGLRMQVTLEPNWLQAGWQMYLGVLSGLEVGECVRLLTTSSQLDMKIGSSDRVDVIFRLGQAGLSFQHERLPPRILPATSGLIYFRVNSESNLAEWQIVQRSLTLALRLNENFIAGNIQGQRTLTIRAGSQVIPLQFTLYVVPPS